MFKSRISSLLTLAAAVVLSAVAVSACTLPDALPQTLQAIAALAGAGLSPDLASQGMTLAVAAAAMKTAKVTPVEAMATAGLTAGEAKSPLPDTADQAAGASPDAGRLPALSSQLEAADSAADASMNAAAVAQAAAERAEVAALRVDSMLTAAMQANATIEPMTRAEAAALVRRRKALSAPGAQSRVIEVPISPDEVLAFKDCGTHVVVVTIDGQKFSSADAA